MPIVPINYFGGGLAEDYVRGGTGECSICRQFDLLTYPYRLQPLRGMSATGEINNANFKIGNMIYDSTGKMFGIGVHYGGTPANGQLLKKVAYGATDYWKAFTNAQLTGAALSESAGHYDFLVDYPETGNTRKIHWSSTNILACSDPDDASSATTTALTFSVIGQGYVHPKDKTLYFPYQTTTATIIGKITPNATPFSGLTNVALTVRSDTTYRPYCLSHYGDYLAVPLCRSNAAAGGGGVNTSIVGLWDRSNTTLFSETIPWGDGLLKVLNNIDGTLIGISEGGGSSTTRQDQDRIQIKIWDGGAEPTLIREIVGTRLTTTPPALSLNHRVNFVRNKRLYFSANIVNGDTDINYYGLFSIGKNRYGQWTLNNERIMTNDGSETNTICAAMVGDYLTSAYTTDGSTTPENATVTKTINGNVLASIYAATSSWESCLNPNMPEGDKRKRKQLMGVYVKTLPLPAAATVTVEYRVDADRNDSWTTVISNTTDSSVSDEKTVDNSGERFVDGYNYEFRVTSTGGGIITEIGYQYEILDTQL